MDKNGYMSSDELFSMAATIIVTVGFILLGILVNVNLIGALLTKDWNWVQENWLSGDEKIIMPIIYGIINVGMLISIWWLWKYPPGKVPPKKLLGFRVVFLFR